MNIGTASYWSRSSGLWIALAFVALFYFFIQSNYSPIIKASPKTVTNDLNQKVVGGMIVVEQRPDRPPQVKTKKPEKTFLELGRESKTTKTKEHHYQCLYEEALAPYRHLRDVKLLEIGLGCGMYYGTGVTYKLWISYFDDVQVYYLEYNAACVEKWYQETMALRQGDPVLKKAKPPIMITGNMMHRDFLRTMAMNNGPWDIIIDDGCHDPSCQIPAFLQLYDSVSPRGTYFLEDLVIWGNHPGDNGTVMMLAHAFIESISQVYQPETVKNPMTGSPMGRITCCDAICSVRSKSYNL